MCASSCGGGGESGGSCEQREITRRCEEITKRVKMIGGGEGALEAHLFLLERERVVRLADQLHRLCSDLGAPGTFTARRRRLQTPSCMHKVLQNTNKEENKYAPQCLSPCKVRRAGMQEAAPVEWRMKWSRHTAQRKQAASGDEQIAPSPECG